jgi:hypothetical protein
MVLRLLALIMAVVAISTMTSSPSIQVYAQAGGAQEESEGDLTVVINGETFTTGQTIIVSGSVDDPGTSPPHIEVFDPVGTPIAQAFPNLSADNTFTFSLVAGENDDPMLLAEGPMDRSGNYRVSVTFFPSFTNMDQVDMEFEYIVTPVPEEQETPTQAPVTPPPTQAPAPTASPPANVTALTNMVTEGLEYVQGLTFKLARANATEDIIGDLEAIQNTFQNLQGNLTRVSPISQGDVLEDNAAATATTSQPQPPQEEQQLSPSPQSGQPVF